MVKKIAFINGKGGCGKTTSIFHTSGVLADKKKKTLVIDLDKQRNTTDTLLMENEDEVEYTMYDVMLGNARIEDVVKKAFFKSRANANPKYYGVDVLPSDVRFEDEIELKEANINIKEELEEFIIANGYEWVLVDMPPSNKTLNEVCFTQIVDNVIVPFSSDVYSVSGYGDLMDTVNRAREINHELNILGIYLARYMSNCAVDRFIKSQLEEFGDIFIDLQIPLMADIREAVMFGRPISFYKMFSKSKTAYENLVEVMEEKIENRE